MGWRKSLWNVVGSGTVPASGVEARWNFENNLSQGPELFYSLFNNEAQKLQPSISFCIFFLSFFPTLDLEV